MEGLISLGVEVEKGGGGLYSQGLIIGYIFYRR